MSRRALLATVVIAACHAREPTPRERAEQATARADALFAAQREDDVRAAVAAYTDALAQWEAVGDLGKQADVAGSLGDAWDNLGDMTKARDWSARALALYRRAGDRHGEAMALSWVGIAEVHLDHARDAIAHFEQARDLARGDDAAYAYALLNLGYAHNELEDWRESEAAITAALPIFEKLGDHVSVATCHNNLGTQRARLGDIDGALAEHGRALAIRLANDQKLDRGWTLCNLGGVELDLRGDAAAALVRFADARAVWTEVGNRVGLPTALAGEARAQAALGRLAEARASFDAAIAGFADTHSARGLAEATVERAEVTRERAGLEDGLAKATAAELPSYKARALLGLAQLDAATGDVARATAELDRGIALIEGMRARVIREEHRRSFFALVQGSYELRIALALAAHDDAGAFAASERARARTLLEALADAGGDGAAPAITIDATAARALLDADTVLVSYVLGARASHAFVLTRDALRVVELPPRDAIEVTARALVEPARHPPDAGARDLETPSAALSAQLIAPLALPPSARVAIVADGLLHFAPFSVLPGLRGREVVYLPSASALAELRRRAPGRPTLALAILADPIFAPDDPRLAHPHAPDAPTLARLRWSRREADGIAALAAPADRVELVDAAADLAAARGGDLARARVVHLATHALVDADHPERSAIVLSQVTADGAAVDGALRLPDIEALRWAAELVVMSGCRTALGHEVRGEGVVGLVAGFLRAGARRVVASLWEVDDRATAELMIALHANLRAGLAPAAALAAAQRTIAADPKWRDPYYWAGFALYGDWQK